MFYLLNYAYNPNTAATNRTLAYIKGLSELGIQTKVEFFITDSSKSRIEQFYPNITINYRWDKWFYINNKYVKQIFYLFSVIFFWLSLKKGDTVYMYNMADMLHWLVKKKGVKVFVEKTEHPSMYPLGSHIYRPSLSTYVKDCRRADGVITISSSLASYFNIEAGVEQSKIQIVNMIVDGSRFQNQKALITSKPYFGYCGSISIYKDGVDILIASFAEFQKKHSGYQLRIAGKFYSHEDEIRIKNLVSEYNLENSVLLEGVIQATNMPSFLMGATAVVLSRPDNIQARNGFPGKLGEYLLSRVPVIVTSVGDIPLFINNFENGLIVKPDSIEDFANALSWVVDNPIEAKVIGENGVQLAKERFNYLNETRKLTTFIGIC